MPETEKKGSLELKVKLIQVNVITIIILIVINISNYVMTGLNT